VPAMFKRCISYSFLQLSMYCMQSVSSVILGSTDGAVYGVGLEKRTVVCDGDPPRLMLLSTRHNLLRAQSCANSEPGRTRTAKPLGTFLLHRGKHSYCGGRELRYEKIQALCEVAG
jgi:hypothetical protein